MKKKIKQNVTYEYKPTSSSLILMTDTPDYSKLPPDENGNVFYRRTINEDDMIILTDTPAPKKK